MLLTVLAGYGLEDIRRSGHMGVEVGGSGTCHPMGRHVRWVILSSSKISDPLALWAPASKCGGPGITSTVLIQREAPGLLCVACMACGVELNHLSFTQLLWDWAYLVLLVSLSSPPPAPSYRLFPGYSRLEKDISVENRWCLWTIQLRSLLTDSWLPWELTTGKPSNW